MNFFINATMPKQKSGIEHAELKRLDLFNKNEEPVMVVLRDWDPNTHINANNAGIADDQLINMFDYFQEATQIAAKKVQVQDIEFGVLNIKMTDDAEKSRYLVQSNEQLVARVNYNVDADRQVKSVEWFDGFNNLYRVDHYDSRGFISLQQWYTPDNKIGTETWQTPSGRTVIEAFHKKTMRGEIIKTGWRLIDRNDQVYQFDTLAELTKYFFDCLNDDYWSLDQPNVFIADRTHLGDWGLLHLKKPAYTVFHLHNAHTADAQNPAAPLLNNNYEFSLHNIDGYDAVVSATYKQTADVRARFQPKTKLFTIPVGIVPERLLDAPRVPIAERQFGKMVVFARIAWEKHLDDLVRAIGIVHQEFPQVTLDLYGYPDPSDNYKACREVEQVIEEYHLSDVVSLKGYTTDIDEVQNNAMMYGLTSRMEGFNLAIMEAISHGLIAFSYDVNYGPNEIVEDGVNGSVVPYGDYQALAQAILKVLRDPKLADKYMTSAYDSAERYSEASVWAAWQSLLADAKESWPVKLAAMPGYQGGQQ
ncbi:glycosyltransferase [Weissella paramesenteroides]|jgi:poly(glycerol-phosphate) alpha-glucosyltransferase|uniref:glycosyltransferase family 4 protein n=1 Tax=Weissella paramesenteroides TaxID=1249 RepID=UPI0023F6D603|nr:glycosyltransferase [Weissella paramesenteroides]MDF8373504.1 glycosyltransferase [Weissella paramesenteroides]WIG65611.1 glycosyltransferase [Weissella paramesenteroides]